MTGDRPLAPTGTPAIAEHLIARLLGKGVPVADIVMTEELANLKMQDYTLAKNRQILYRPEISAVYLTADMATIRTDTIIQGGGCV